MQITGTHVNYFFVCRRKLWLYAQGITMEHTSEVVLEGKLLHEQSYGQRASRYEEVEIGPIKIDFFDAKNGVVHEVKKSNKVQEAHRWQLKYYLWVLERAGVLATGVLEYPKLRRVEDVFLSEVDRLELVDVVEDIERIAVDVVAPVLVELPICGRCSYFEFCFCGE